MSQGKCDGSCNKQPPLSGLTNKQLPLLVSPSSLGRDVVHNTVIQDPRLLPSIVPHVLHRNLWSWLTMRERGGGGEGEKLMFECSLTQGKVGVTELFSLICIPDYFWRLTILTDRFSSIRNRLYLSQKQNKEPNAAFTAYPSFSFI